MPLKVLGIESSCDECSASVIEVSDSKTPSPKTIKLKTLSLSTFSQIELHQPYGGVVPEVASRSHLEQILPVIQQSLKQAGIKPEEADVIAVTNKPGLVGALLVGVSAAKTLAYALKKPLVGVHHLEGHAASLFLDREEEVQFPLLMLLVSGGHTQLQLMKTFPTEWSEGWVEESILGCSRDDAAGEAFDKVAKILGFPYPGGAQIEATARTGNPKAFSLPKALPRGGNLEFSFSGLKTAASLQIQKLRQEKNQTGEFEKTLPDFCASFQAAILDQLLSKLEQAAEIHQVKSVAVVGGVAANQKLRDRISEKLGKKLQVLYPHAKYCTDNGAMIAAAGAFRFLQGRALSEQEALRLNAYARAT